nr:hypothetical protein [Tanacetum cinerariifolium]
MVAEVTVVFMETSEWMGHNRSDRFLDQVDAIELYCKQKLQLKNCTQRWPVPLLPFEKITPKQKPAPVVRFHYYSVDLGEMLSKEGIALDIVNYGTQQGDKTLLLNHLVEIADEDNGSGRILHLPHRLYKSDILPLVGKGGNFDRKRRRDAGY